jgi:hypothetical protein
MVRALVYRNTRTTLPGWVPIHDRQPRGIAYESDTHFIHRYGRDSGLWVISSGLTATQEKNGILREWVEQTFGAIDIEETTVDVGDTFAGVWRPGLYFDDEMSQGLATTDVEMLLAEQSLLLLIHRLDEVLLTIEPTANTLSSFGHKTRELLILACTEAENYWKRYMVVSGLPQPQNGFTTNDYIRLRAPLFLHEFEVSMPRYSAIPAMRPFLDWSRQPSPTTTLPWYHAYQMTKHDRDVHFDKASLSNCIQAVAANLILFSVRFGPFRLLSGVGSLPSLFNQLFSVELRDCSASTFYMPLIMLEADHRRDLICFESREMARPRNVLPVPL